MNSTVHTPDVVHLIPPCAYLHTAADCDPINPMAGPLPNKSTKTTRRLAEPSRTKIADGEIQGEEGVDTAPNGIAWHLPGVGATCGSPCVRALSGALRQRMSLVPMARKVERWYNPTLIVAMCALTLYVQKASGSRHFSMLLLHSRCATYRVAVGKRLFVVVMQGFVGEHGENSGSWLLRLPVARSPRYASNARSLDITIYC
jgi:hypothetical protein